MKQDDKGGPEEDSKGKPRGKPQVVRYMDEGKRNKAEESNLRDNGKDEQNNLDGLRS